MAAASRYSSCNARGAIQCVVLAAALMFGSVASAAAQVPRDTVDPGTIIRIHVTDSSAYTARLATWLTPGSSSVEYCALTWNSCAADSLPRTSRPLSGIRHLDARHTESMFGAILGAGAGAMIAYPLRDLGDNGPNYVPVVIGAALFAGLGAILGSAIPRWVRVF
ncbi:MAG: hypothetical protein ACREL5_13155 [Gemmatimonadales bacterium]